MVHLHIEIGALLLLIELLLLPLAMNKGIHLHALGVHRLLSITILVTPLALGALRDLLSMILHIHHHKGVALMEALQVMARHRHTILEVPMEVTTRVKLQVDLHSTHSMLALGNTVVLRQHKSLLVPYLQSIMPQNKDNGESASMNFRIYLPLLNIVTLPQHCACNNCGIQNKTSLSVY